MNESQALTLRQVTPSTWQMIESIAPAMHQSRFFGVTSADAAKAIMLKGFELGLGLAASFEMISVIQNKPTLSPRGALALIHQSGQLAGMKIDDKEHACRVWMKRTNGFEYELTYTLDDAKRAGLVTTAGSTNAKGETREAGNWEKYESNMLRWRCVGFVADVVFPDVIGGMRRADEFGANVDASGNVIEGTWTVSNSPVADASAPILAPPVILDPIPVPSPTFFDLVAKYGPDAIMAANDGRIPTDEEVAAVAAKLEGGI